MKKLTKVQKAALMKAFRLLRAAGATGERLVHESDNDPEFMKSLLEHAAMTVKLASDIETALQMHLGSQLLLEGIEPKRTPKKPATRPRPALRLVHGGRK